MKVEIKPINLNKTISRLGLEKRGRIQKVWTAGVARRIRKYLPYRNYGSVPKAMDVGTDLQSGLIDIRLPYAKYLYYGKAMAGDPRRPTKKDLVYTKSKNRLAGPFWDRRLVQNEMEVMEKEILAEIKRGAKT